MVSTISVTMRLVVAVFVFLLMGSHLSFLCFQIKYTT